MKVKSKKRNDMMGWAGGKSDFLGLSMGPPAFYYLQIMGNFTFSIFWELFEMRFLSEGGGKGGVSPRAGDFGQITFSLWTAVSPLVIGGCGKGLGSWSPGLGAAS